MWIQLVYNMQSKLCINTSWETQTTHRTEQILLSMISGYVVTDTIETLQGRLGVTILFFGFSVRLILFIYRRLLTYIHRSTQGGLVISDQISVKVHIFIV